MGKFSIEGGGHLSAMQKFGLIAPVVYQTYREPSAAAYFKATADKPILLDNGKIARIDWKTLERWYYLYQKEGYNALEQHVRVDKGTSRILNDAAIEELYRLKGEFPRMNATQIHKRLVANGYLPKCDVSVVQRFMKKHDLKCVSNPNVKDRRAFEADAFGAMWQADTCYMPAITEDGEERKVFCIAIIDDYSRVIVAAGMYESDNAYNFQKTLRRAVMTYGMPRLLYVDNGASYANDQLEKICGLTGIVLIHAKPRAANSKGKIERFWLTLKMAWLYTMKVSDIESMTRFDESLAAYIREYNTTEHSSIGMTPMERYSMGPSVARPIQSLEWLDDNFHNRENRKVARNSTIRLYNDIYDAPTDLIGQTVEVRFLPGSTDDTYIVYDGQRIDLHLTDLHANFKAKRRTNTDQGSAEKKGNSNNSKKGGTGK